MSYKITFLFLILCSTSFAQVTFEFDKILEYDYAITKEKGFNTCFFLVNSEKGYFAHVTEKDEDNFNLCFTDRNIYLSVQMKKDDFYKAEILNVPCKSIRPFNEEILNLPVDEYDYRKKKDTLMDGVLHKYYTFRHINSKKEKRRKWARFYYVAQPGTEDKEPLLIHPTAFAKAQIDTDAPKGYPKLSYRVVMKTKDTSGIHRLKAVHNISKYITYIVDCDVAENVGGMTIVK